METPRQSEVCLGPRVFFNFALRTRAMPRRARALASAVALLLLILLSAIPSTTAYGVRPHARSLLQKQEEGGAANSDGGGGGKKAPPAPATPVDDPADWPPTVLDMLGGYLDNKDLVRDGENGRVALSLRPALLSSTFNLPIHRPPASTPSPPGARPPPPGPTLSAPPRKATP